MIDRPLALDSSYDATTQAVVGTLAAGLDDQLRRLREAVSGLSIDALEWQSAPGMNSIGVLLAHIAIVEVWWIDVAPGEARRFADGDARYREVLGIGASDDGIPLAANGGHPDGLRGLSAGDYAALLDKARACVHDTLRTWTDAALDDVFETAWNRPSKRWALYHVLEHLAGHFGQILLVRHQLRDAGLVAPAS